MTAPTLPAAPARVGVAAGWWVTSLRHSAQTGHRLTMSAISGRRSNVTLCGRTLNKVNEVRGDLGGIVDLCRDCRTKAARCPDPSEPVVPATSTAPAPTQRRGVVAARTVPVENTAAARVRRRAAFRGQVGHDRAASGYVPQPYGLDAAAARAASLTDTDHTDGEGGVSDPR